MTIKLQGKFYWDVVKDKPDQFLNITLENNADLSKLREAIKNHIKPLLEAYGDGLIHVFADKVAAADVEHSIITDELMTTLFQNQSTFVVVVHRLQAAPTISDSLSETLMKILNVLKSVDQRQRDQEAMQLMNSIYPTVPASPSRSSGDFNQRNWRGGLFKQWNADGFPNGFPKFVQCMVSNLWLPSQLVCAGHILPYTSTDSFPYQQFGVRGVLWASGIEDCFNNHRVAFLRHRVTHDLVFHVLERVDTSLFDLYAYTPPDILTHVVEQHSEWPGYRLKYPEHSRLLLLRFLFGDRDGTMPLVRHFHNKIVSFSVSAESCDRPPARRALSYHALKSFHSKHLRIETRFPLQPASKASIGSSSPQITSPPTLISSPQGASAVTDFQESELQEYHAMVDMLVKSRNDRKYEEPIDLSVTKLLTDDYIQVSPDVPDTLVTPSVLTDAWTIPHLDLNQ